MVKLPSVKKTRPSPFDADIEIVESVIEIPKVFDDFAFSEGLARR